MSELQEPTKQMPLALVNGSSITDRPDDLFIPPDALEVFLTNFEGPLDFLLYIIRKQQFNIIDLPIMKITEQYMEYINLMETLNIEIASEYLLMAAILAEIKSRLLLPVIADANGDDLEEDPRAKLVQQLIEYEKNVKAAQNLDSIPRFERDTHAGSIEVHPDCTPELIQPNVVIHELVFAMQGLLQKADNFAAHEISREAISTRERLSMIIEKLSTTAEHIRFSDFFSPQEGRAGVVVTFLAILELTKE